MNILLLLVPVALLMGGGALAAFIWALRSGQFDDLEGDKYRIFMEDYEQQGDTPPRDPDAKP